MPEIDDELVARAVEWCAAAGQRASPEAMREALAPLSWDELLSVRACLADPPPAALAGPLALAYLARGAPPGVDAEGAPTRFPGLPRSALPGPPPTRARGGSGRSTHRRGTRAARPRGPIIHRAGDRPRPNAPTAPVRAPLDELSQSEGRSTLERLVRENGARRGPLLEAMGQRWRRADGGPPADEDLTRLLAEHGLSRAFARRERDEILHALRAAGGDRQRAASAIGLDAPETLDSALARLGATAQAESIREAVRIEIRRRATLTERARLLLLEEEHLRDLGLLAAVESDLAARLPEHLRALRASRASPLAAALARSLSLRPADAQRLARRLGLEMEAIDPERAHDRGGAGPRAGSKRRPRSRPPPRR